MLLKLIILTAILVGVLVLAMGIRFWLDPTSEMAFHSCSEKPGRDANNKDCLGCQISEIVDCERS